MSNMSWPSHPDFSLEGDAQVRFFSDEEVDAAPLLLVSARTAEDMPAAGLALGLLRTFGVECTRVETVAAALARLGEGLPWRALLVDIDGLGPLATVVTHMIALRRSMPETPVVMMSDRFSNADTSRAVADLADVVMRLPASPARLEEAISEAVSANRAARRAARLNELRAIIAGRG